MGDSDRIDADRMRGTLENHLLHRNLVLFGGGVHSHIAQNLTSSEENDEMNVIGLGLSHVASGSGKRERKRTGGNGIFGSISNKRRKRLLHQLSLERESKRCAISKLKTQERDVKHELTDGKQAQSSMLESDALHFDLNPTKSKKAVGTIIGNLHEMWIQYIRQLLHVDTTLTDSVLSLSLADLKHVSMIVATAEHVGMPATIVKCSSRRHLIGFRCVVVNETKETWRFATIFANRSNKNSPKEMGDVPCSSIQKTASAGKTSELSLWKILIIPKRGTTLEVDLPVSKDYSTVPEQKITHMTVRLET